MIIIEDSRTKAEDKIIGSQSYRPSSVSRTHFVVLMTRFCVLAVMAVGGQRVNVQKKGEKLMNNRSKEMEFQLNILHLTY